MENATKALVMAGAILIAILLISVGIIIFRSTRGVQDQVGQTSEAMGVSIFNSKFTQYLGEKVSAVQVRNLISTIQSSNSKSPDHPITVVINSYVYNSNQMATAMGKITDPYYEVKIHTNGGYSNDGFIQKIKITTVE